MDVDNQQVAIAVIGALGTILTAIATGGIALLGILIKRVAHATELAEQVNASVNHRGPGEDTLYQLVYKTHAKQEIHDERLDRIEGTLTVVERQGDELVQWKQGYTGGELSTGDKANEWLERDKEWKGSMSEHNNVQDKRIADLEDRSNGAER